MDIQKDFKPINFIKSKVIIIIMELAIIQNNFIKVNSKSS